LPTVYPYFLAVFCFLYGSRVLADPIELRGRVLAAAAALLELGAVSYTYGGHKVDTLASCDLCSTCLDQKSPEPKQRLSICPDCSACSLDCSHFVAWAFARAGAPFPYLPTDTMLNLSAEDLRRRYGLVDVGLDWQGLQPADLVVYNGHVVLVESVHKSDQATIVHSTSGREIKGGGNGIQRARHVYLRDFRGPALRILRSVKLIKIPELPGQGSPRRAGIHPKLRPVQQRAEPDKGN
jgi:hypothetical protein